MNRVIGRSALALIMLLTLASQLNLDHSRAQEAQPAKKKFSAFGYYPKAAGCHPVMVRASSIGADPPEVLTAQVTIENLSPTPITAVKLGWNVYRWDFAMKKRWSCDASPEPAETFLSGSTPLVWLGRLAQKETCNISTNPLRVKWPATKTVFVEQPIIAWDQVKPLTHDGTRNTFKEDYAALIYVSEIHFEDGTKWTGEIK